MEGPIVASVMHLEHDYYPTVLSRHLQGKTDLADTSDPKNGKSDHSAEMEVVVFGLGRSL